VIGQRGPRGPRRGRRRAARCGARRRRGRRASAPPRTPRRDLSSAVPRSGGPRADPADSRWRDPQDIAGRWIVHRWELHPRPDVHLRKALEQLWRTSLGNPSPTMDDHVFVEADGALAPRRQRQHDARIAADIAQLLALTEVPADDLVALKTNPDDRHLRTSVGLHSYQVRQAPTRQRGARLVGENRHPSPLSSCSRIPAGPRLHYRSLGWRPQAVGLVEQHMEPPGRDGLGRPAQRMLQGSDSPRQPAG
jgi:hypothetical protein